MDITWVSEMYKTNNKHQLEMHVLNVSIRNYLFNDYNTEIIIVKVVLVDTLDMCLTQQ